jgi:predicted nucleic acid-binding protein
LRATLEKSRQLVGGNDLLIAAQALTLGYTIVTDNDREFSRSISFGWRIGCARLERVYCP